MDIILPKLKTVDEIVASVKQNIVKKTGFEVTDAVCPIVETELKAGFQQALYFDAEFGQMSMIIASQTKSLLFNLFTDLTEELFRIRRVEKSGIDAVFESRHIPDKNREDKKYDASGKLKYYRDYIKRRIDPIAFLSMLYDFEDLFMNDGFAGISIMSDAAMTEVRFSVHKTVLVFTKHQILADRMAELLRKMGVPQVKETDTVEEKPHVHIGNSRLNKRFRELITICGAKRIA